MLAGFNLSYTCNVTNQASAFWGLTQTWPKSSPLLATEISIFNPKNGFGFFTFNQSVLPNFFSAYSSSVLYFYVAVVYVIAVVFRYAFVPYTWQVFVVNAPFTEDLLSICQCIYTYRVQGNLKNEEELFFILIDILRTPETIKSLSGSSLKKELD